MTELCCVYIVSCFIGENVLGEANRGVLIAPREGEQNRQEWKVSMRGGILETFEIV